MQSLQVFLPPAQPVVASKKPSISLNKRVWAYLATHPKARYLLLLFVPTALCWILYRILREWKYHSRWYKGFYQTVRELVLTRLSSNALNSARYYYCRQMTASDGEIYTVWYPKTYEWNHIRSDKSGEDDDNLDNLAAFSPRSPVTPPVKPIDNDFQWDSQSSIKDQGHLWICLPGGMQQIDYNMFTLSNLNAFAYSKWCVFNNPGISSSMKKKLCPSPVEIDYLAEFIQIMLNKGYSISVIGFSVGGMQAMKLTQHPICDRVESVISIHSPDVIRHIFERMERFSLFRIDIFFALTLSRVQWRNRSMYHLRDKLDVPWYRGWKFVKNITEASHGQNWDEMENQWYSLRESCKTPVKRTLVLRVLSRNDPVVPFEMVDQSLFSNLAKVVVVDEGGHCGISACQQIITEVREWNTNVLKRVETKRGTPQFTPKKVPVG